MWMRGPLYFPWASSFFNSQPWFSPIPAPAWSRTCLSQARSTAAVRVFAPSAVSPSRLSSAAARRPRGRAPVTSLPTASGLEHAGKGDPRVHLGERS